MQDVTMTLLSSNAIIAWTVLWTQKALYVYEGILAHLTSRERKGVLKD